MAGVGNAASAGVGESAEVVDERRGSNAASAGVGETSMGSDIYRMHMSERVRLSANSDIFSVRTQSFGLVWILVKNRENRTHFPHAVSQWLLQMDPAKRTAGLAKNYPFYRPLYMTISDHEVAVGILYKEYALPDVS